MTEREVFLQALEIDDPVARAGLIEHACAGQPQLRQAVEELLKAHDLAGEFLKEPHPAVADSEQTASYGPESPIELAGTVIAGKYKLVEQIGEGGMGSVWLADQTAPVKRRVAVKLIKAGMDSKSVIARFEAERQALAVMDHPNIAKVLDGGLHDNRPFFVMELVKGVPMTQYCDAKKLTPRERLALFVPVCQAIQHAHQKGIIHRDIKPSNVLIAPYDDKPVPKVIDFGLAKATGVSLIEASHATNFGGIVGTPQYMSPEQTSLNNLDIDTRSDIYSLGVLLYELLTGSPPFKRKDLEKAGMLEILRVIRDEEPPKPSTKLSTADALPSISANRGTEPRKLTGLLRNELDWVVMKALEKDRSRRYETANGFAADINRFLVGEPVVAHPPSAAYRMRKFVKRNKGQVLATAVVAATMVIGIIGTAWQWQRARDEQGRTQQALNNLTEEEARTKLALAQVTAEQARLKVEKKNTIEALNAMTDDVVEKLFSKQPKLSDNERDFLKKIIKLYEQATADRGDAQEGRALRAEGNLRVASIQKTLNLFKESEANYGAACDILKILVAEFPDIPQYHRDLAVCHHNLGKLLSDTGRGALAEAEYRGAGELLKTLTAEFPANPQYRHDLSKSLGNLGTLLAKTGRGESAEMEYQTARDIQKTLVEEFPTEPKYRADLAKTRGNLAILLAMSGRGKLAEEEFRARRDLEKQLVAEFPEVPTYRASLATSHANLGQLLMASGRGAWAEVEFRAAIDLLKDLAAEFRSMPTYRGDLAEIHSKLGLVLDAKGRGDLAELEYSTALALQKALVAEFPAVPEYRNAFAGSLVNRAILLNKGRKTGDAQKILVEAEPHHQAALKAEPRNLLYREFFRNNRRELILCLNAHGDHAAIPSAAKDLATYSDDKREDNYNCACHLANAIALIDKDQALGADRRTELTKQFADEAMKYLQESVANGYTDHLHIKKDTDLDALRDREDFKKLLADLEAKAAGKK